jgi:hypothetical protein
MWNEVRERSADVPANTGQILRILTVNLTFER